MNSARFTKFFNYLLISNIFTGGFCFYNRYFDFYVSYIFMAGFLSAYIFFYKRMDIARNFLYILSGVFLISLVNVFLGNNSLPALLKVTIGFIFNGITYYLLIRLNGNKVEGLFRIYMQIACVVALIGIFQEISFLIGFKYGYDFRFFIPRMIRPSLQLGMLSVTSIIPEPSHFGTVMAPAVFASVLNIMQEKRYFIGKKMSCLIIISVLLSFSLMAYVGVVVAFALVMLNYKRLKLIILGIILLVSFTFFTYRFIPEIRDRVNDTIAVINGKGKLEKTNLSTFAFCSNALVTYKSFIVNPLFGSGLGSYPMLFDKYIEQIVSPDSDCTYLCNKDSGSLFFRLISETGLLGIALFFYFICRFYIPRKKDEYLWIVSNAILCLFILNLIRLGNYFYNGFIFFVWAYYFANKNVGENQIKGKCHDPVNSAL